MIALLAAAENGSLLEKLGIEWQMIVIQIVGFVLLVWLLKKFAWGPILNLIDERAEAIRDEVDKARNEREESEKLRKEYEEHLAKIREEAQVKLNEALAAANKRAEEIEQSARDKANDILEASRDEIRLEAGKARIELKDFIVNTAVKASEAAVKRSLDADLHAQIIDDMIKEMDKIDVT